MVPGSPTAPLVAVKVIKEEQVEEQNQLIEEQNQLVEEQNQLVEEQNQLVEEETFQEMPDSSTVLFDTVYQSNENFEIEKPAILQRTKSNINQTKINS